MEASKRSERPFWPQTSRRERFSANASSSDLFSRQAGTALRRLLSAYQQIELMLKLGEYQPGSDALTDMAVDSRQAVDGFLRQDLREPTPFPVTLEQLSELTAHVPA